MARRCEAWAIGVERMNVSCKAEGCGENANAFLFFGKGHGAIDDLAACG